MRRALLPWLASLALLPAAALGLILWRREGALVWLSDFVAACF